MPFHRRWDLLLWNVGHWGLIRDVFLEHAKKSFADLHRIFERRCPMPEEREFVSGIAGDSGFFEITAIESRAERLRQLMQLALGLAGMWLAYEIATWADDPGTTSVRLWTLAVVVFGLAQIGRAVSRFVVSVSARQARVFRCSHLVSCGVVLLAVAVALVTLLLRRGPLTDLLAHGGITGGDIADLGFVIAAGFCLAGGQMAYRSARCSSNEREVDSRSTWITPGSRTGFGITSTSSWPAVARQSRPKYSSPDAG
jgi:hypothetical protein